MVIGRNSSDHTTHLVGANISLRAVFMGFFASDKFSDVVSLLLVAIES